MPPAEPPARVETGARAEALAAEFLVREGLAIAARHFRTRRGEIDKVPRRVGISARGGLIWALAVVSGCPANVPAS